MEAIIRIIVLSIAGGLIYGAIKTALQVKYPERYGLDPDWYKATEDNGD